MQLFDRKIDCSEEILLLDNNILRLIESRDGSQQLRESIRKEEVFETRLEERITRIIPLYSSEIKAQHDPERDNRMLQRVFRLEKCSPSSSNLWAVIFVDRARVSCPDHDLIGRSPWCPVTDLRADKFRGYVTGTRLVGELARFIYSHFYLRVRVRPRIKSINNGTNLERTRYHYGMKLNLMSTSFSRCNLLSRLFYHRGRFNCCTVIYLFVSRYWIVFTSFS